MDATLKQNIKEKNTWMRGFYMLLFVIFISVVRLVVFVIVVFQFLSALLTRKTNQRLLKLGQSLSTYAYQILVYITYNSEHRPYPFGAWPKGKPSVKGEPAAKAPGGKDAPQQKT